MQQEITEQPKQREYLFDNYKVFLIILVVIGHFIEPCYDQNSYLYELKWAIVAFHMPAFIFISGYFSKKTPSLRKLLGGLVIPYFVYEIIYYLLYTLILHKKTGLYLARPKFSLWYLMALFAWRVLAPLVRKIPGYLIWTTILGLLIGFVGLDNFLSIPRIVYFFPFFLAGMDFETEWLDRFRNKRGFAGALAILAGLTVFLLTDKYHDQLTPYIFYGRYSYQEMDMGNVQGVLIRMVCYLISFLLIYLFMLVLPREKKSYSYLGQRTMAIYIFHGMIYSAIKYKTSLLTAVNTNVESMLLILFCLLLVWVLSRKPFVRVTDCISHLI